VLLSDKVPQGGLNTYVQKNWISFIEISQFFYSNCSFNISTFFVTNGLKKHTFTLEPTEIGLYQTLRLYINLKKIYPLFLARFFKFKHFYTSSFFSGKMTYQALWLYTGIPYKP